MPVLALKWHYIAHFQSKLLGTYAKVWIERGYPGKGIPDTYPCKTAEKW
jgi:hypothetical protein